LQASEQNIKISIKQTQRATVLNAAWTRAKYDTSAPREESSWSGSCEIKTALINSGMPKYSYNKALFVTLDLGQGLR